MIPITVRMEDETHRRLVELAKQERRSLNNMINFILESYVNTEPKRPADSEPPRRH